MLPYCSLIEFGNSGFALQRFRENENDYVGFAWEELCRSYTMANKIDGVLFGRASRWWGNYFDEVERQYKPAELDVVAESIDGNHIFVGECKWQERVNAEYELERLKHIVNGASFAVSHEVHYGLFLRDRYTHSISATIFTPHEVMAHR